MTDEPTQPQPPSESGQGLLSGFGGLEGIDPPKDVQARDSTILEKLLDIEERLVRKYKPTNGEHSYIYLELYPQIKDALSVVPFTEDDLRSLILTKANLDCDIEESQMLGIYTGMLLTFLTERNREQGKRTRFYIDGQGNNFDNLFLKAKDIDELVVENFNGDDICMYAGGYGHANRIVGININGKNALSAIGYKGSVKQVLGIAMNGVHAFSHGGTDFGRVNQIIAVDISGEQALGWTAFDSGRVSQLICAHINGSLILDYAAWNLGGINQFVHYDVSQFSESFLQIYGKSYDQGMGGINEKIELTHLNQCGKDDTSQCTSSESNARKIILLADRLQGKPYQEVLRIADELYALRPQVPDGFFERK